MTTTAADIAQSSYTPLELSYLLAGRTTPAAERARAWLGLDELTEGDDRILAAVQSLVSKGLAEVHEGEVQLSPGAAALGYVIGKSSDWTKVLVSADGQVDMLVIVAAPDTTGGIVLRADPMGNFTTIATKQGVHPSQLTGTMVASYFKHAADVGVSVHRELGDRETTLAAERRADGVWTLVKRNGLEGREVSVENREPTDEASYFADLELLLADKAAA